MLDWFLDGSRVFMLSEFIGQGYKDLYMLANIRGALSECHIGQIAFQLLKGIEHLHFSGIVLRHLKP